MSFSDLPLDRTVPPQACASMGEVRAAIDALDRALVALLAQRQAYMDAAARIKQSRAVVRDEARIADVMAKVHAAAAGAGLSPAIAEPVWRTLMDRCIAYELQSFDALRNSPTAR